MESDEEGRDPRQSRNRGRVKKLVFGSLAAGGALALAGIHAQAHGNASSHSGVALRWNFDDYVVRRQELVDPADPMARDLRGLADQINALQKGGSGVVIGNRTAVESVGLRTQRLEVSRSISQRVASLRGEQWDLESRISQRWTTQDVLTHFKRGDAAAAIALIESRASPAEVMQSYIQVQLDLHQLAAVDGRSTPLYLEEIVTVSNAGMTYWDGRGSHDAAGQKQLAALLHNLASFTLPDLGEATKAQRGLGMESAKRALAIRLTLADAADKGRAYYMVGVHSFAAKDFKVAEKNLQRSIDLLKTTREVDDLAWSTGYLGLVHVADGKVDGPALLDQARRMFLSTDNSYAVGYLDFVSRKRI